MEHMSVIFQCAIVAGSGRLPITLHCDLRNVGSNMIIDINIIRALIIIYKPQQLLLRKIVLTLYEYQRLFIMTRQWVARARS